MKNDKAKKAPKRRFRVWFPQVNQTYVDVTAKSTDEMFEKAARAWRRWHAHNQGNYFEELGKP